MGGLKYIHAAWIRSSQSYGKLAPSFTVGLGCAVLTNGSILLYFFLQEKRNASTEVMKKNGQTFKVFMVISCIKFYA